MYWISYQWTVVRRTALTNGASLIEKIESSKVMVIYWWGCCRDQLTAIPDLAAMDFVTSTIHTWISQPPQIFGVGWYLSATGMVMILSSVFPVSGTDRAVLRQSCETKTNSE